MTLGSLRAALVLATRQARRQKLRAVAILATLAVPVAVVTAADVVARTVRISPAESLDRQLGGAQAVIDWVGYGVLQTPDPRGQGIVPATPFPPGNLVFRPGPAALPPSLVPPRAVVTAEADVYPFLDSPYSGTYVEVRGVDLRSRAPGAGVRVRSGRVPVAAGEIALSPTLATSLHAHLGATLRVPATPVTLRVVGIVADRYAPGQPEAFTSMSTAEELQALPNTASGPTGVTHWYVSSPAGIGWPAVEAFNARGWQVTSRRVIDHPPSHDQVPYYRQQTGTSPPGASGSVKSLSVIPSTAGPDRTTPEVGGALLAVMLLLEVALMAGPAFAVGARRRRHELAVIAAAGGTRRQLISFVAADGLLLGGVAAVMGALVGVDAGAAVLAGLRAWTDRVPGPVTVRSGEIVAIASLALLSGLLAAALPALSASRADTAQVLGDHQGRGRLSKRPVVFGAIALAVAVVLGLATLHEGSRGGFPVPLVLAAALAEVGFVLLTPAILGLAGLVAPRLPLWPRIAVRDASRSRSSATPAVAAVIAVVAAATAALVFGSSVAAHDRVSWVPSLPTGDALAYLTSEPAVHLNAAAALAAVRTQFPSTDVATLDGQTSNSRPAVVVAPGCPSPTFQSSVNGGSISYGYSYSYSDGIYAGLRGCNAPVAGGPNLVDGGRGTAVMLGGNAGRQAAAALRAGKAVVFSPSLLTGKGDVTLALGSGAPSPALTPPSPALVPAVLVASSLPVPVASVILPPSVAITLRLQFAPFEIYVKHAAAQPAQRLRAADQALERLGISGLYLQAPYSNDISSALLAVAGADLLLTVAATVAASALIAVDSADDLLILAAIGAPPRGRRRLATSRAAVICGIGSVCGVLAGLIPGIGLVWRLRVHPSEAVMEATSTSFFTYPLHIPVAYLAIVMFTAPLAAAGAAALISRSKLPSEARRTK